jgi:type I restriction enzyme S subunit
MRWPSVSLGEVASLERRSLAPEQIESGTNYLGLEHIESGGRIIEYHSVKSGELKSNKFMFDSETLLYGKLRPYLAKVCIPDRKGCCSTDIIPIRPGKHLDIGYLRHLLLWKPYVDKAASLCSGANLPRISPSTLLGIEIPLPPLEEQRRIAAILDASQRISQLHSKRIIGLSALRQSLYRQLASQPGSQLLSLSSLAKITSGYAFKATDFCERGVHIIRMSDLNGEYVDLEGSAKVPPVAVAGLDRFELFEGDILLGMSGSLGKLGIVPTIPAGSRAFLNQRVAKISLAPDSLIGRELLIEGIKSNDYLTHLERCAAGVAVRNVSATQMLDCVFPVPTPHERNAFAEQCRLIGVQIRRSERCISQSAALQASLSTGLLGMQ